MTLAIYKILQDKEQSILTRWQSTLLSAVSKPSSRFTDPMAYAFAAGTEEILKWLIKADPAIELAKPLEAICRLKAVQDISPSEALDFVFALKLIIREAVQDEAHRPGFTDEIWDVDQRIDKIAMLAFDIYSACRTQIYEIRVSEIKRMYGRDVG